MRDDHIAAGHVTVSEAKEILSRFNASHFRIVDRERARYTIPADPRRDDDIRMSRFIAQVEEDVGGLHVGHAPDPITAARDAVVKSHEAVVREVMRIRHAGDGRLTRLPTKRLDDALDAVLAAESALEAADVIK